MYSITRTYAQPGIRYAVGTPPGIYYQVYALHRSGVYYI